MLTLKSQSASLFDKANSAWAAGRNKCALQLFFEAAKDGDENAFNSIGYFFDHGIGVKKDVEAAYIWYRRAAKKGDLASFINLGIWFRDMGNNRRAKFWFEKAYSQGDGSAAYHLGTLYLKSRSMVGITSARRYLHSAVKSKYVSEDQRQKARELLSKLGDVNKKPLAASVKR